MGSLSRTLLLIRLVKELFRYDLVAATLGFQGVRRGLHSRVSRRQRPGAELETAIPEAVSHIVAFYWKPVRCLQRSIVTARVLRAYGLPADVVIGYLPVPFVAHAWVEVDGRIVNDSPAYQHRLRVLERI